MPKLTHGRRVPIALCMVATFTIVQSLPAIPQSPSGAQLPETRKALAEHAQRNWLRPVVESLQHRAQDDQQLLGLLDQLDLWALEEPRPEWGPNAVATDSLGKPVIYVDLAYLNQLSAVSDLAGLALTGRDEGRDIAFLMGFQYGQAIRRAIEGALPTPQPSCRLEDFVSDPGLRVAAERLSLEAFFAGVAWTVLHEVAHHRLGHLEREPQSKSESRKWELEADSCSFSMLNSLGYGLAPIQALLATREIFQELRIVTQLEYSEAYSDHPTYATRRKQLERLYDVSRPAAGDFLVFLTVWSDAQNQPVVVETIVPRYPDSEGHLYAFQDDVMLAFDWKGGQIHLYGRDAQRLTEMIIHEPHKLRPEITFRETRIADGAVSVARTWSFQLGVGWSQTLQVGSLAARQILETSPRRLFSEALRSVENRADVIRAAENVNLRQLQDIRRILIRYARGLLSLAAGEEQAQAVTDHASARLKKILGAEQYGRLRDSLFSDALVQFGLDRWIARQGQKGGLDE